jgi:hypothetical protein
VPRSGKLGRVDARIVGIVFCFVAKAERHALTVDRNDLSEHALSSEHQPYLKNKERPLIKVWGSFRTQVLLCE